MKTKHVLPLLLGALFCGVVQAADQYPFKDGYSTDSAAQTAQDDADYQRAVTAYRFWYPTVSGTQTVPATFSLQTLTRCMFVPLACLLCGLDSFSVHV
jgi:hypothetical protein